MQQLLFEAAWDKTMAPIDRERITELFYDTKECKSEEIVCVPVRQAFNHKNELLITVLIHNFKNKDLSFNNIEANCHVGDTIVTEQQFSFPHVSIPKKSSMPWTFIFPASSWQKDPHSFIGKLHLSINGDK